MHDLCHRCHGELPTPPAGHLRSSEDAFLFCPRCGAPQILLPEYLHAPEPIDRTTGTIPPPRPAGSTPPSTADPAAIDWRAAILAGGGVAIVSALLAVISLKVSVISLPSFICTAGGAVIALGFYARMRPLSRIDAKIGLRIGAVTGLLIIAAMAIALAITGVAMRFSLHAMSAFDTQVAQMFSQQEQHMRDSLQQQNQPADVQQRIFSFLSAPEVRSGFILAGLALQGTLIFLLALAGGAFSGMLRTTRPPNRLRQGD